MKEVKELLRKHDYITVIQKSGDGCIITYPHPKLMTDSPRLVESFSFQRGSNPGIVGSSSFDSDSQMERFVAMPEYAIRLYVMSEAINWNAIIHLDTDMVLFLGEDKKECDQLTNIIPPPSTEDGLVKEDTLFKILLEAQQNGFSAKYQDVADAKGVGEGYQIIKKFYE